MGHVWLARDERSGLDVSLKMIPREGKMAERAEREARAAAALRHPRCQRIFALARDPGHIYIAYEYVPGRTLRQALAAGQLGDREAVEVAAQVLEALAHAHGRGIVHRDVKPSNVLLGEGPGVDVRLLDFGLAQMAEFDTLTAIGDVPGTLAYISPERLMGKHATAAADVWAVGVMLWEALAGRHPFRAATAAETSRQIQSGPPGLDTVRPDLPGSLHTAIAAATALNPARRPPAAELAAGLRPTARKRKRQLETPSVTKLARRPQIDLRKEVEQRLPPALFAAVWTGWVAASLPFYPAGWAAGLAAFAGALGAAVPRAGLLFALTATFFPLANISLGLALLFALIAAGWTALTWSDPRGNLVLVAGALLAPIGALAFLPLVAQLARGPVRRGAQAAAAVIVATIVAGLRHQRLPFDDALAPLGLGISGSDRPSAVAAALAAAIGAHPVVLAEAGVLAAAAVALPYLRGRGLWAAAGAGSALLAATALVAPLSAYLPIVAAGWLTAVLLAAPRLRRPVIATEAPRPTTAG